MIEDTELLRRYATTRSEADFAELVRRRIGLVYAVALQRTRDAQLAEDAVQAVFSDLARKAAALSDRAVLIGWLHRSALYAATDLVRAEQSRAAREKEAQFMQEISASDRPPDTWEKVKPLLDEVMSELDESDRDAILLRFFDGRSFGEVGARFRLSENAARMRVERALDRLHAAFARRDIKSTTAVLGTVFAQQAMAAAPAGLATSVTSGALATASTMAAASPVVTMLQFMTTTKMVAGVAGVALMIAVLGTAYEMTTRWAAEAALAVAREERSALGERLREVEQAAVAAERETALLKEKVDEAVRSAERTKAKAAAAAQANKGKPSWDPVAEGKALLARHPELKRAVVESADASTRFMFGGMYRELDLTPAQIARFEELMREASVASVPLNGEMATLPAGEGKPWVEVMRSVAELLGEENRRKMIASAATAPDRRLAVEMASALCFTDSPLTPAQSAQLVQIMTGSRSAGQGGLPGEINWAAVAAKAGGILSGPQLVVLKDLYPQVAEQALLYQPVK